MTVAYALLTGAALMRVFAPSVVPGSAMLGLVGAASLWTLAFGLFVGTYAPILWRPRIDGRPG